MATTNPIYGPFFGVMGAASAIIFSGMCNHLPTIVEMADIIDPHTKINSGDWRDDIMF